MQWIQELAVGDEVIVNTNRKQNIGTVTRMTKIQIVIGNKKFRKNDGWQVGADMCYSSYISQASAEEIEEIKVNNKKAKMVSFLTDFDWGSLPDSDIEDICKTVLEKQQ